MTKDNRVFLQREIRKTTVMRGCFCVLCVILSYLFAAASAWATPRETYAEARKFMREGTWTKALEYLVPLEKDYALLADYTLFDMGVCYTKSGSADDALAVFRRHIRSYRNSPLYRKAYRAILEIVKTGDTATALSDYDGYLKEFPQDGKALWEKAELLEKNGQTADAAGLFRDIFLSGSPYSLKAYEILKKKNQMLTANDIKRSARRLMDAGSPGQAAGLLESAGVKDEEGMYLLGKASFRLRQYRGAIKTLSGISFSDSNYFLAMSLLRANEKDAFYNLIEKLAKNGQKEWFSLHNLSAELKRREGKGSESYDMLQSMMKLYPEREEDIAWSQAWLAIRQNRLSDAEGLLAKLAAGSSSKEHDKYVFWLGKVKDYQGQDGRAVFSQIRDKTGYYWFRTGNGARKPASGASGRGEPKDNKSQFPEDLSKSFQRIRDLNSLGMKTEAGEEARSLAVSIAEPYVPSFAQLLSTIEDYATLVRLGIKNNDPAIKYPLAFPDSVAKHARDHNLDPLLVIAIMREESRFRCDAVSSAGARGVMQLMPATARKMGNLKNNDELFEAEKNIALGTRYLSKLLAELKTPHYAVAAYNAGERNVESWLTAEYRDEDEFAEDIPFGETKNYVFKVMQTYNIMKSLYGNGMKQ